MARNFWTAACLSLLAACGTGVGNPGIEHTFTGLDDFSFEEIVMEYEQVRDDPAIGAVDCGAFDEESTSTKIQAGEACIRQALAACEPAIYLFDQTNPSGTRIASFVSVVLTNDSCVARVHAVSTDPTVYYGSYVGYCLDLPSNESIVFACQAQR